MQTSRNPAKSRPLSANVKRLMRLARASPQNSQVIKVARQFTGRDLAYCHKQGNLFMEAASMGFSMEEFAPLFMTSSWQASLTSASPLQTAWRMMSSPTCSVSLCLSLIHI